MNEISNTHVLDEAQRIVYDDRNKQYGPAENNFARIGQIWGALLDTEPIEPRTVALMMIGLKIARDAYKPKRDNMVDVAGYAELAEAVFELEPTIASIVRYALGGGDSDAAPPREADN